MLKDSLGQLYRKVIFLQVRLILLVTIAAFFIEGQQASLSAFVGGAAVLIGGLVYSVLARESKGVAISGKHVLGRHVLAEVAKTVAVLSILMGAFTSGWFVAGWLVAAMGAASSLAVSLAQAAGIHLHCFVREKSLVGFPLRGRN